MEPLDALLETALQIPPERLNMYQYYTDPKSGEALLAGRGSACLAGWHMARHQDLHDLYTQPGALPFDIWQDYFGISEREVIALFYNGLATKDDLILEILLAKKNRMEAEDERS